MARRAYARRYAQAVFKIALERKELDRWQADLTRIASVVSEPGLMEAMESPKFGFEAKAQLLAEQLKENTCAASSEPRHAKGAGVTSL
ncbi:F0F1 ATP synthase subunit delta [Chloroflexota bacterium]